jgi:large subunit ribosomal protein L35Ae
MKGTIASFRGSRRIRKGNQCIIIIDKIEKKEDAEKLVGKTATWITPAKKEKRTIQGKITAAHGKKGAVRVLFEKGMPGQSIGTEIEIA